MSYRTVLDLASALSDTDKLKLAYHLLGQLMLAQSPSSAPTQKLPPSTDYDYCLERVLKSKPNRLPALRTFLEAIFIPTEPKICYNTPMAYSDDFRQQVLRQLNCGKTYR
ncbi:hypothetical protein, partial [Moraxella equi]